ncbi:Protease inhibitor/seed storage/lipid transfer protein family protein [Melia azedarach]|uniref:Protease inhibitor/seed storage/lipid transfer protein family protein n=1 Tax=Melia azedarach TaxID=155640 RepID=A0ACC1YP91_MELAZ|nr:Protease inhibitor/seed storage/lipid transfer protein family protein [Melia azedarach]
MAKTASKVLVQRFVAMFLIALVNGAMAMSICNIDSSKMKLCLPAVNGNSPPPPTKQCCAVVHGAHLPCLCGYRNILPAFGINPKHALALPNKCGFETPPECRRK